MPAAEYWVIHNMSGDPIETIAGLKDDDAAKEWFLERYAYPSYALAAIRWVPV